MPMAFYQLESVKQKYWSTEIVIKSVTDDLRLVCR